MIIIPFERAIGKDIETQGPIESQHIRNLMPNKTNNIIDLHVDVDEWPARIICLSAKLRTDLSRFSHQSCADASLLVREYKGKWDLACRLSDHKNPLLVTWHCEIDRGIDPRELNHAEDIASSSAKVEASSLSHSKKLARRLSLLVSMVLSASKNMG